MEQTLSRLRTPLRLLTVLIVVLMSIAFMTITGCDEAGMLKPVVPVDGGTEPVEQPIEPAEPVEPTEPTTNGDVKKPEEPSEPEPEPEPVEPTPEPEPEPEPTPEPEPVEPGEEFVGRVLMPIAEYPFRGNARAVAKVTLTIMSGSQSGEQSSTNKNGYYSFANIAGDTLHLRAEKEGFEPKEVIVHRSEPTTLADGTTFDLYEDGPQKNPGVILIGHKWPDKVRFILEETTLPPDLLFLRVEVLPERIGGWYAGGVVVVKEGNCLLHGIAHELGHAHQHIVATADQGPLAGVGHWENTPEGKAYAEAMQKDWDEVGKASYDGGHLLIIYENMAETANYFWNIRGKFDTPLCSIIKTDIPNRLKWAEEWLGKK